ncbi:MAG TPA: hypothetical protein VKU01_08230 [Bryobacteraceae bacterium]|nr:hypothetical protein [Bryobacteraceae bacterium]
MTAVQKLVVLSLCGSLGRAATGVEDVAAIMSKVAVNLDKAAGERRLYLYHQKIRSTLIRGNGVLSRKENREYLVFPTESATEKKLLSFSGEYRKGRKMLPYTEPGYHYKGLDVDGDLVKELTDGLVSDEKARDGIPPSLFPLTGRSQKLYRFSLKGEGDFQGRHYYRIAFEPLKRPGGCIDIDEPDECEGEWRGEAWIDAAEYQPIRIATDMAAPIPWGVRVFLGTNLRQTGFSVTYQRVAENVWFPATYGTEFYLNVFWGYKRTITLSMENNDFRKTDASSTVQFEVPKQN